MDQQTAEQPVQQQLVDRFIAEYLKTAEDPAAGPDPSMEDLVDTEDELSESMAALDLLELTDDRRTEMRGLRLPDLPSLMAETADGLRDCPEVAQQLHTDPAIFDQVAEQDLTSSALTHSLLILHNGTDTGLLLRGAEAERMLDEVDDEVASALDPQSKLTADERVVVTAQFNDAQSRRLTAQRRQRERAGLQASAVGTSQSMLDQAQSREEVAAQVRDLVQQALAGEPAAPAKAAHGHAKTAPGGTTSTVGTTAQGQKNK